MLRLFRVTFFWTCPQCPQPPRRWSGYETVIFFYPPDTNFDFPKSGQDEWFSPLPGTWLTAVPVEGFLQEGPQHQLGKGAAGRRDDLLPPWKQLEGGVGMLVVPQPSLWPLLPALHAHGAKPLHPLLGNMPTLVAVVHPEDWEPSSPPAFPQGKSRAHYGNTSL